MSNRFHNKFHSHNHHTKPTDRDGLYPDSAYDPIASREAPFKGEFYTEDDITAAGSLSARFQVAGQTGLFHGDVTVKGNLEVLGTTTQLDTLVYATSAFQIENHGTGPALKVTQFGQQPLAHFIDFEGDDVVLDNSGFLGLGTFNPNKKLTVVGDISAARHADPTNYGYGHIFNDGNTTTQGRLTVYNESHLLSSAFISNNLQVHTNTFNVSSGGNGYGRIGINTTIPTEELTVVGDAYVTQDVLIGIDLDVSRDTRINRNFYVNTKGLVSLSGTDGNSKVGVNTLTPNVELTVKGSLSSSGNITTNGGLTADGNFYTKNAAKIDGQTTIGTINPTTNPDTNVKVLVHDSDTVVRFNYPNDVIWDTTAEFLTAKNLTANTLPLYKSRFTLENSPISLSGNTINVAASLSANGNLTATGTLKSIGNLTAANVFGTILYSDDSNSREWKSVYTTMRNASATWDEAAAQAGTGGPFNTIKAVSGTWDSTYTTVKSNSGTWNTAYNTASSVFTTVNSNSANWNSLVAGVVLKSGDGMTGPLTINPQSGTTALSLTGDINLKGTINIDTNAIAPVMSLSNPTGYGRLEVGGLSGGYIDFKSPFTDDFDIRVAHDQGTSYIATSGDLYIKTGTNIESLSTRAIFKANGRVGIRNETPGTTLHVGGALTLSAENITVESANFGSNVVDSQNLSGVYIQFTPTGSNNDWAYLRQIGGNDSYHLALDMHDDPTSAIVGNLSGQAFSVRNVGSSGRNPDEIDTLFTVNNHNQAVRFGINTANPTDTLDVSGTAHIRGNLFINKSGNDYGTLIIGRQDNALEGGQISLAEPSTNTAYWFLDAYGGATPRFRIFNNAGEALNITHDRRFGFLRTPDAGITFDVNGLSRITGGLIVSGGALRAQQGQPSPNSSTQNAAGYGFMDAANTGLFGTTQTVSIYAAGSPVINVENISNTRKIVIGGGETVDNSGNVYIGTTTTGAGEGGGYGRRHLVIKSSSTSSSGGLLELTDGAGGHGIVYRSNTTGLSSGGNLVVDSRMNDSGLFLVSRGSGAINFYTGGRAAFTGQSQINDYLTMSVSNLQVNINKGLFVTLDGAAPRVKPAGWGGGVTTFDIYSDGGTIGIGAAGTGNPLATINNAGQGAFTNLYSSGNISTPASIYSNYLETKELQVLTTGDYGRLEVGGLSGAYIDLKAPFSDDVDFRISHIKYNGTAESYIESRGNLRINTAPIDSPNQVTRMLFGNNGVISVFTPVIIDSSEGVIGNSNSGAGTRIEVKSSSAPLLSAGSAAYMVFHRPNSFAGKFGLDTDNRWKVGGWSHGDNSYRILHEGLDSFSSNTIASFGSTTTSSLQVNGTSTLNGTSNLNGNVNINNNGVLFVGRQDGVNEGGEIQLAQASNNAAAWHLDVLGTTGTGEPRFRIHRGVIGEALTITSDRRVGIQRIPDAGVMLDVNGVIRGTQVIVTSGAQQVFTGFDPTYVATEMVGPRGAYIDLRQLGGTAFATADTDYSLRLRAFDNSNEIEAPYRNLIIKSNTSTVANNPNESRITLGSGNKVGIGPAITTPAATLHVGGDVIVASGGIRNNNAAADLELYSGSTASKRAILSLNGTGNINPEGITFSSIGNNVLSINSAGRTVLGSSAAASALSRLHINRIGNGNDLDNHIFIDGGSNGTNGWFIDTQDYSSGIIPFRITARRNGANTNHFVITNIEGNVGIGMPSNTYPTSKLTVVGNISGTGNILTNSRIGIGNGVVPNEALTVVGNISATGRIYSLNLSDTSPLSTISLTVQTNNNTDAIKIIQTGSGSIGNALAIYDENPTSSDSTPFVIKSYGTLIAGLSTTLPGELQTSKIQVTSNDRYEGTGIGVAQFGTADKSGYLRFLKSRSTTNGVLTSQPLRYNDKIGSIDFYGDAGSPYTRYGAAIVGWADGDWTNTNVAGRLSFHTASIDNLATGSVLPSQRMVITSNGNVGINTSDPKETLDVDGTVYLAGGTASSPLLKSGDIYPYVNVEDTNLQNTYIHFGEAGSYADFALLRQIGGDDSFNLSFDLHGSSQTNTNYGQAFSIRNVFSRNSSISAVKLFTSLGRAFYGATPGIIILAADAKAYSFGTNYRVNGLGGALAFGSTITNLFSSAIPRPVVTDVGILNDIVDIKIGTVHSVFLLADGTVYSAGHNSYLENYPPSVSGTNGLLGMTVPSVIGARENLTHSTSALQVVRRDGNDYGPLTNIENIYVTQNNSIFKEYNDGQTFGRVWTTGSNRNGQRAIGTVTSYSFVNPISAIASVSSLALSGATLVTTATTNRPLTGVVDVTAQENWMAFVADDQTGPQSTKYNIYTVGKNDGAVVFPLSAESLSVPFTNTSSYITRANTELYYLSANASRTAVVQLPFSNIVSENTKLRSGYKSCYAINTKPHSTAGPTADVWSWGGSDYGILANGRTQTYSLTAYGPDFYDYAVIGGKEYLYPEKVMFEMVPRATTYSRLTCSVGGIEDVILDPFQTAPHRVYFLQKLDVKTLSLSTFDYSQPRGYVWAAGIKEEIGVGVRNTSTYHTNSALFVMYDENWSYDTTTYSPLSVKPLDGIVKVAMGEEHTLFLRYDGSVYGCGDGRYGQLGDIFIPGSGISKRDYATLIREVNQSNAIDIQCTRYTSHILLSDGRVLTLGRGRYGELGINTPILSSYTPNYVNTQVVGTALGQEVIQDRFHINNVGKVGVNTSTPQQQLHVAGNTQVDGNILNNYGQVYTEGLNIGGENYDWSTPSTRPYNKQYTTKTFNFTTPDKSVLNSYAFYNLLELMPDIKYHDSCYVKIELICSVKRTDLSVTTNLQTQWFPTVYESNFCVHAIGNGGNMDEFRYNRYSYVFTGPTNITTQPAYNATSFTKTIVGPRTETTTYVTTAPQIIQVPAVRTSDGVLYIRINNHDEVNTASVFYETYWTAKIDVYPI